MYPEKELRLALYQEKFTAMMHRNQTRCVKDPLDALYILWRAVQNMENKTKHKKTED